jgi:DNA replication and repair protein RecF
LFGPDDLALTKESPAVRRRFLDRAVFNVWPAYLEEARDYQQALKSRNQLLRQQSGGRRVDATVMASFDQELARRAARVMWRRLAFIRTFRPLFVAVLDDMTAGGLTGDMTYRGGAGLSEDADEAALQARAQAELERATEADLARGFTTVGPHTHDLKFELAGRSVRRFASQGQHRAFVLALKIAELVRVEQELGVFPALLLDDVSSELDRERNAHLMSYLDTAGGQVFITTTDRRWIQVQGSSRIYSVSDGAVR